MVLFQKHTLFSSDVHQKCKELVTLSCSYVTIVSGLQLQHWSCAPLNQQSRQRVRRGHQKQQALTVWPWPARSCSTGSLNIQLESPVMFALRRHSSDQAPLEHSWLGTVRQQNQSQEPKGHSQGHIHIIAVGNDPQWNICVLSKHPR